MYSKEPLPPSFLCWSFPCMLQFQTDWKLNLSHEKYKETSSRSSNLINDDNCYYMLVENTAPQTGATQQVDWFCAFRIHIELDYPKKGE